MTLSNQVDLVVAQGEDFGVQISWTDAANNPFKVFAPMRMEILHPTGSVAHTLQTSEVEDEPSTILYNSDSGLIQLLISSEDTAKLQSGTYQYDLFVSYQDNRVTGTVRRKRLLRGRVIVEGRITKNV